MPAAPADIIDEEVDISRERRRRRCLMSVDVGDPGATGIVVTGTPFLSVDCEHAVGFNCSAMSPKFFPPISVVVNL